MQGNRHDKNVVHQSPSYDSNKLKVIHYPTKDEKQNVTVSDFSGLTVGEANALTSENNLNTEINGINLSTSNVVAYHQSTGKDDSFCRHCKN